jgi:hypothetical protein
VDFALSQLSEAETNVPTRQLAGLQASFQGLNAEIDSIASGNASGSEAFTRCGSFAKSAGDWYVGSQATVSNEAACS